MFYKTEYDEGLIQVPAISPHLEMIIFDDAELGIGDNVLNEQLSREMNYCFYIDAQGGGQGLAGTLVRDMLRLIDGARTREEIVAELQGGYDVMEINTMLANLAYRFILISADYRIQPEQASLFSSLGITPRRAEAWMDELKISIQSVSVHKDGVGIVTETLLNLGCSKRAIVDDEKDADIVIVLVDDYLQTELESINQRFVKHRKKWMPLKLGGVEGMIGPLFNLQKDMFCLQCLTVNLRNNRELRGFLGYRRAGGHVAKEYVFEQSVARGRAVDSILQLIRTCLFADDNHVNTKSYFQSIAQHVLSSNLVDNSQSWHRVNKRPQCACCGDSKLRDNARSPEAVDVFQGAEQSVFTSGGMKARLPMETWLKYQHLISPLTGVVTAVIRSSPADDSWMHVYWAGSNLAIVNRNYRSLTNSLRTKSAGKGRSDMQAKVSALCEALERYSGVYDGDEIHHRARFVDFAKGEALRPNDIMLFSDNQYQMRGEVASKNHRFYRLPEVDFDEQAEMEWTPLWSVSRNKFIWMLSSQMYYTYFSEDSTLNKFMGNPDSNGSASGNTISEAFVQGFMELVERDAFAIWWYNQLTFPEVDIGSFNDPFLDQLVTRYRAVYNRSLWVIDITHDFGIPVFVAVSERIDKEKRDICVSGGAHFDPHIALLRAVCELNQYVSVVLKSTDKPDSYSYYDPECLHWWQNATLQSDPYLLPDTTVGKTTKSDYPVVARTQAEEVQACIDIVHSKDMEVLVMDQTKVDIGFPVVKVVVPGMRHFWARFGLGRLYDVPVEMGKLSKPTAEQDLNTTPVFI